jgi:2-polyprenyl-6-methoxyphenol hydroxylase-like FAD-dependent oxidoreductase
LTVLIIGAGIGGLVLALELHRLRIPVRIYEQANRMQQVGVGINILPHATKILAQLGLQEELEKIAVTPERSAFFNRFGQLIYDEPLGRAASYEWPQISIHRADLQNVLLRAFLARVGPENLFFGHRCLGVQQDDSSVTLRFDDGSRKRGSIAIACDGIHSEVRKQFYPQEGAPLYSGYNMWRGVTKHPPILGGNTMIRAGWLATGKMVIYPIQDRIDASGRQLVNWVAEVETPQHIARDWNRRGNIDDFIRAFSDWNFDWLDAPALIQSAETILEFPMVDQEPLERWSFGRATLLGDAAHPMYPRGSNGAGQAILDARALAEELSAGGDPIKALRAYEARRLPMTSEVVRTNRTNPPDAILREVYLRTGDRPFERIEDVIPREELVALSDSYKRVAGYDKETLHKTTT